MCLYLSGEPEVTQAMTSIITGEKADLLHVKLLQVRIFTVVHGAAEP
jgi:hypothetical protein